jgi:hypothetical protein
LSSTPKRSAAWRAVAAVVILGHAALIGGCGNLTSGGYGDLEVLVASDSVASAGSQPTPAPAAHAAAPLAPAPAPASAPHAVHPALAWVPAAGGQRSSGAALLDGTLTLRVQVFALSRPGVAYEVTDGVQEVVMPLSGGSPVLLARKSIPAGTYSGIRTVFLHVEAMVEAGLIVDGVAIRGPVRVDLGSRLVVDSPVALTIEEAFPARVSVNLHTNRWIRLLTVDRRVRSEDFEGEVKVGRQP